MSRLDCSSSLHIGFRDVSAIDFDEDLSVFFSFLLLFLKYLSVVDEVERQKEAQHTEDEKSDVDLEEKTRISQCSQVCVCFDWVRVRVKCGIHTQNGSPSRGPIMARKRGCCSRANTALTRDCMPVRLPNWEDGYLQRQQ